MGAERGVSRSLSAACPQVGDDAAEGKDGDDEQHRAGVLDQCSDDARGETAGQRGLPAGVLRDRGEQALAPAEPDCRGEQCDGGGHRHRVVVQLIPRGGVAARDDVAQVPGRAGVEDAAGVVARAVRRREVERGERDQRRDGGHQHDERAFPGDRPGEHQHGRDGKAGADENHAADTRADPRRSLDHRQEGPGGGRRHGRPAPTCGGVQRGGDGGEHEHRQPGLELRLPIP